MKAELIGAWMEQCKADKVDVSAARLGALLSCLGRAIGELVADGVEARIPGVCILKSVEAPEREVRIPASGERVIVPAHRRLNCVAAMAMKRALNPVVPPEAPDKP
ncbi:MAG: HU family DNA-binding protein [Desulfobulbaceae bacterium]|jgi:nucleoid DNA-binding protein|nr:HU family DNA-binding protein [Desulfobulbaceae bacterium]